MIRERAPSEAGSRPPALPHLSPADEHTAELISTLLAGLYEVHTVLGPGFVHRIYANACYHELRLRGLDVVASKRMQVAYKGAIVGDVAFGHLSVEGKVMVFPVALGNTHAIRPEDLRAWMALNAIPLGILVKLNALNGNQGARRRGRRV